MWSVTTEWKCMSPLPHLSAGEEEEGIGGRDGTSEDHPHFEAAIPINRLSVHNSFLCKDN